MFHFTEEEFYIEEAWELCKSLTSSTTTTTTAAPITTATTAIHPLPPDSSSVPLSVHSSTMTPIGPQHVSTKPEIVPTAGPRGGDDGGGGSDGWLSGLSDTKLGIVVVSAAAFLLLAGVIYLVMKIRSDRRQRRRAHIPTDDGNLIELNDLV